MTSRERRARSLMNLRKMRGWMIIAYAMIIIISLFIVSFFTARKNEQTMKEKVMQMTSSLNVQLSLNLENYLSRMESIATLAFSLDNAYTYDATNSTLNEYDKLNLEKTLSSELSKLCLMENFVDYGIIYRDNTTLGKISNGTTELFGNDLFIAMRARISRERTHDGWFAGYKDDYQRVYYVKQIHENAVLVMSFYTSELEDVFDNPETLNAMTIRLTDQYDNIIYSSQKDELGSTVPEDIFSGALLLSSGAVLDDQNLTTINSCNNVWNVICSIPTDVILQEEAETQKSVTLMTIIAALIAAAVGTLFSVKLSDPISIIAVSIDE